eukprot:TRINITY_DN108322_c0_g1_i1.p1 TRINITY_DN108322_c0_g1~~TRINITY_DN108322_c0_g1_i1.p1  ORF type:complete len:429 (+),score=3.41 TRINITY_DN108322_c0_g1_i1:49-1335(+)
MADNKRVLTCEKRLAFPAYKAWDVVKLWDLSWLPKDLVTSCEVGGRLGRVGAERKICLFDGNSIHERLLSLEARVMTYNHLSASMPLQNYKGKILVDDGGTLGDDDCTVKWSIEFEFKAGADTLTQSRVTDTLTKLINNGVQHVEFLLQGKPKACEMITTADKVLVPKESYNLGLPRNPLPHKSNTNRKDPMQWDFSKPFPIQRVSTRMPVEVKQWQHDFVDFCLDTTALKLGDFETPTGKIIPYHFQTDVLAVGQHFYQLGKYYAQGIIEFGISFDLLYGTDVGLPYVAATCYAMMTEHQKDVQYCFIHKDPASKLGFEIVGASPKGQNILVIADVLQHSTSIRDNIKLLRSVGGNPVSVLVGLDCQEKGNEENMSCMKELEVEMDMETHSIITTHQICEHVHMKEGPTSEVGKLRAYIDTNCIVKL